MQILGGELKFRANDTWDVNWGNNTFPEGTGILDGPNIPAIPGTYDISFNDATGAYAFTQVGDAPVYETVGLIGGASPGGWGASVPMNQDPNNPHRWTLDEVTLTLGEAKFRANDSWDINWGDLSFPVGIGLRDGPNIQAEAGVYDIAFNDITGAYTFTAAGEARLYETVGIIGNATANGWDASTPMNRDTVDLHTWTLNQVELTNGEAKFRANDTWDVNWGSTSFSERNWCAGWPQHPGSGRHLRHYLQRHHRRLFFRRDRRRRTGKHGGHPGAGVSRSGRRGNDHV